MTIGLDRLRTKELSYLLRNFVVAVESSSGVFCRSRVEVVIYSTMALSDSSLSKSLRKASDSIKVTNSADSTEGMPSEGAAAAGAGAASLAGAFFPPKALLML